MSEKCKINLLKSDNEKIKDNPVLILSADEKEEDINESVFFVEANSFEKFSLWKEYKNETNWEEISMGYVINVGYINNDNNKPVNVEFSFCKIYGKKICFYSPTSRYVDYSMIEEFLKTNYPKRYDSDSRWAMTDSTNFHNAILKCKNDI